MYRIGIVKDEEKIMLNSVEVRRKVEIKIKKKKITFCHMLK